MFSFTFSISFSNHSADFTNNLDKLLKSVEYLDFSNAESAGKYLVSNYPESPEGSVLLTYVYTTFMNTFKTSVFEDDFNVNYELAEVVLQNIMENNSTNQSAHFYLGVIYCYDGMMEIRRGHYFRALKAGVKGINYLENTVKTSQIIYDSYFGLSQFSYYKYLFAKNFSWVIDADKERELAYSYIDVVKEHGQFMKFEAQLNELVMKQIDMSMDDDFYLKLTNLFSTHPQHIILSRLLLDYYFSKHEYTKALKQAEQSIKIAENFKLAKYPLFLPFIFKKAEIYERIGQYSNSYTALMTLTNYEYVEWHQNDFYEKLVVKLKKNLENQLSENENENE